MTWFRDLTSCSYFPGEAGALNVGWLDDAHDFPVADPDFELVNRLDRLCREHRVNQTRGWHSCQLCRDPVARGSAEIRVQHADGVTFAAPELVAHYVRDHRYEPAPKFVKAVMADVRSA